jgi:Na+/proline symporter
MIWLWLLGITTGYILIGALSTYFVRRGGVPEEQAVLIGIIWPLFWPACLFFWAAEKASNRE